MGLWDTHRVTHQRAPRISQLCELRDPGPSVEIGFGDFLLPQHTEELHP